MMGNVIPMIRQRAARAAAQVAFDATKDGLDCQRVEVLTRTAYAMVYEDHVSAARAVRDCGKAMRDVDGDGPRAA